MNASLAKTLTKVCVVTGSRAEYGLLRRVIKKIDLSDTLELQLVVTGMHLSPEFGYTIEEIISDDIKIHKRVEILLSSDSPEGTTKSMGLALIGFADAFKELKPDILLILGDRFEIFAVATAALIARIPIAHCHGGELTEGAFDDALRHSITKMSSLHFVAASEYAKRVHQLGEEKSRVINVGGLGVDAIKEITLISKEKLQEAIDFTFSEKNILVSFHAVTLDNTPSELQMRELLNALDKFPNIGIIFTLPNADTDGRKIISLIQKFCREHNNSQAYASLGQLKYLSCLKYVDAVVGNSSSGLLEAPSLQTHTINIGSRQKGRLRSPSIIDCEPKSKEIELALLKILNRVTDENNYEFINPYGNGGAAEQIVRHLENTDYKLLNQKFFVDLK
ncbi:MAG: UDP-N-acetylglucosamine 2-epimerase (hydrolyzing) [Rhodopirellula sp.]|nr:UDP-N-acetylglucosamine 2-epimerase (hydrolyzing) [Rhodopirellula sp.]